MPGRKTVSRKPVPAASVQIVGVGASAGGLEALDQFLGHIPANSGLALVIVQHLDPTRKGMMVELLQRATPMQVVQASDGMEVEPDRVYVIPPNKDMSILHGSLLLLEPTKPRGQRLPIDTFFRALAEDQKERAAGVVLSGMGSDGTAGLKAIKANGGAVFVQAPSSAQFDAMPRSAIEAGLGDVVASAEELGAEIAAHLKLAPFPGKVELPNKTQSAIEKIFVLLRSQTGHDFSLYKKSTVYRRIERRMSVHKLADIASYVRFLQGNAQEAELLFKELLIGVTGFFRDLDAWELMLDRGIPSLLAERPVGAPIRAWVPACSTGEEAYSLAILLHETLGRAAAMSGLTLQIFATDLDKDAIEKARQGIYAGTEVSGISAERLKRFFVPIGNRYQVSKQIRESVVFAPHNLVMDPPFTRIDILSCRNFLIYLTPELQQRLISLFHYSLRPGGVLFLGSSESVGANPDLFASLEGSARIYRRLDHSSLQPSELVGTHFPSRARTTAPPADRGQPSASAPSLQALADRLVLQRFAPPSVLTNDKGDIVYIVGRTGKYLEPASGRVNWNIFAMAREGLVHELGGAFRKAVRDKVTVTLRGMRVAVEGGVQFVDVNVEPIIEPEALRGTLMIVFTDVPSPSAPAGRSRKKRGADSATAAISEMEQELKRARVEAGANREEMQSWLEELTSSNEELQSTNEELQSTNEELTTSREEMQSLNEEMQTLNSELQAKVDELSRAENDMRNLLDSTDIATLFLDTALNVRRFTTHMTRLIKLIPGDTGRPITDLASDLIYPELVENAREVLRTLQSHERSVSTADGRWFTVRIMPYRTLDDRIDGVVITFADITVAKELEATLRARSPVKGRGS